MPEITDIEENSCYVTYSVDFSWNNPDNPLAGVQLDNYSGLPEEDEIKEKLIADAIEMEMCRHFSHEQQEVSRVGAVKRKGDWCLLVTKKESQLVVGLEDEYVRFTDKDERIEL